MDIEAERKIMDLARRAMEVEGSRRSAWLEDACAGDALMLAEARDLLKILEESHQRSLLADLTTPERLAESLTFSGEESTWWRNKMIGPYQVLSLLGEGGMGWVFLAQQTAPVKRLVALKMVKHRFVEEEDSDGDMLFPRYLGFSVDQTMDSWEEPASLEDSGEMAARTQAEPQMMAKLSHPNIAQIFEVGRTPDGFLFFSMEYVPGTNIADHCRQHRLSLEARLQLFMQVCQGVHHAHIKGVLHLDLKPSNILVCDIDGQPVPKIIDFGIARPAFASGSESESDEVMGTPEFMSPEALGGKPGDLDMRADVYALGAILFELITGLKASMGPPAHTGDEADKRRPPSDYLRRIETRRRRALAGEFGLNAKAHLHRLETDLDSITTKAMARNRADRYDSAAALATDLAHFLEHLPVAAVPATRTYYLRKFLRRNLIPIAVLGVVFALLSGGIAARTVEARRANAEAERANRALSETQKVFRFVVDLLDRSDPRMMHDRKKLHKKPNIPWSVESERDIREGIALMRKELPSDHPFMRRALNRLATVQIEAGEYEQAIDTLQEAMSIHVKGGFDNDRDNNRSRFLLGTTFLTLGRLDEAERLLHHVERNMETRRSPPPNADFLDTLGVLYTRQGKYRLARETLEDALYIREWRRKREPFEYAETLHRLAVLDEAMERHDRAESVFQQALAMQRDAPMAPHQYENRIALLHDLGHFYLDRDKIGQAEPLLESARQKSIAWLAPATEVYQRVMDSYQILQNMQDN